MGKKGGDPVLFYKWSAFGYTMFIILPFVLGALCTLLSMTKISSRSTRNYGLCQSAGWYMDEVQLWSISFVLPGVIALLGSYMICHEEDEDTIKSLHLIPVNEAKLTAAKMIVTFVFSILLYLLLFVITCLTEAVLHASDLSAALVLGSLKGYLLDDVGVFLALSPMIALTSHIKKYWLALVFAEFYSVVGLLAGMSSALKHFFPILAVFNVSGYYITTTEQIMGRTKKQLTKCCRAYKRGISPL